MKTFTKISMILFAIALIYAAGFSMRHGDDPFHLECATFAGVECAFGANAINSVTAHLDILKGVSTGILSLFLILASLLVLVAIFGFNDVLKSKNLIFGRQLSFLWQKAKTSALKKQLDWLSIQEKRDPSLIMP